MDSTLKSFIPYDENHHFPLENIPFGMYHAKDGQKHACTRIGDKLIDLAVLFPKFDGEHFASLKGDNVFLKIAHHGLPGVSPRCTALVDL